MKRRRNFIGVFVREALISLVVSERQEMNESLARFELILLIYDDGQVPRAEVVLRIYYVAHSRLLDAAVVLDHVVVLRDHLL